MNVRDIMTPDPVCRTKDTSLQEIARLMMELDCGCIPILEDPQSRRVAGVVTDRDIVCRTLAQGKDALQMVAGDCMSQPVITISPDATLGECSETLERNRIRRLPVVDANKHCIGIVAMADLVKATTQAQVAELMREVSVATKAPATVK